MNDDNDGQGGELTLWKDIDRKIIENLDEKSILSICSSSKKLFNQICNDSFLFLADHNKSSYITGSNIAIDGGFTAAILNKND